MVFLAPDTTGHITPAALEEALTADTVLLSCQLVNNEIGTVQPVAELGALLKAKAPNALFHIDAVQGLCRVALTPKKWNCDLMSVSGHKIGAPKGIGALYVGKGLRLPPLMFGGGQEKGLRPGTEPLPNIAAFARACEIRMAHFDEDYAHVAELAAYLKEQAAANLPDVAFNGEGDVPHVVNLSIPGCKSEVMLRVLEGDEVCVERLGVLQGQAERRAPRARPAQSAHGQRHPRVVRAIQHKRGCGCVHRRRAKRREDAAQVMYSHFGGMSARHGKRGSRASRAGVLPPAGGGCGPPRAAGGSQEGAKPRFLPCESPLSFRGGSRHIGV